MRVLRALLGALLWIAASLLGLVAVILCVTIVLLPVGIPLLALARRLFTRAIRLFMPRELTHPLKSSASAAQSIADRAGDRLTSMPRPDGRRARKNVKKRWKKVANA